ncbi:MAG: hypothetical protein HKP61_01350 [Dactylosporangium sp.]|nr:hypothetical protein [Dactylosporangium sp.]NNJ59611.1 hypothetical protein [Dactylosporangium sp.]
MTTVCARSDQEGRSGTHRAVDLAELDGTVPQTDPGDQAVQELAGGAPDPAAARAERTARRNAVEHVVEHVVSKLKAFQAGAAGCDKRDSTDHIAIGVAVIRTWPRDLAQQCRFTRHTPGDLPNERIPLKIITTCTPE